MSAPHPPSILDGGPVPMWICQHPPDRANARPLQITDPPLLDLLVATRGLLFRGVTADRLPDVLTHGIDVDPPGSVIFGSIDPHKAHEYGPVILMLRWFSGDGARLIEPALDTRGPETSDESWARSVALRPFPAPEFQGRERRSVTPVRDEAHLNYLAANGFFITGDPWEALAGIMVAGDATMTATAIEGYRAATNPSP